MVQKIEAVIKGNQIFGSNFVYDIAPNVAGAFTFNIPLRQHRVWVRKIVYDYTIQLVNGVGLIDTPVPLEMNEFLNVQFSLGNGVLTPPRLIFENITVPFIGGAFQNGDIIFYRPAEITLDSLYFNQAVLGTLQANNSDVINGYILCASISIEVYYE